MQKTRSTEQGTIINNKRLYYCSKDYIVQEKNNIITMVKRNGGGSNQKVNNILKMLNMKLISKLNNKEYLLGAN